MHRWLLFIYLFGGFLVFFPTSLANKKKFQVNQFDDTGCKNRKFAVTVPRRWGHSQRPPPRPRAKRPEEPKLPTAAGRAQGLRRRPGARSPPRVLAAGTRAGRPRWKPLSPIACAAAVRGAPLRVPRSLGPGRREEPPPGRGLPKSKPPAVPGPQAGAKLPPRRGRIGAASRPPLHHRPRPRSVRTAGRPRTRAAQVGQRDPPQAPSCGRAAWPSGPESPARGSVPGARAAGAARPREHVPGSGRWVLLSPRAAGRRSAVTKGLSL